MRARNWAWDLAWGGNHRVGYAAPTCAALGLVCGLYLVTQGSGLLSAIVGWVLLVSGAAGVLGLMTVLAIRAVVPRRRDWANRGKQRALPVRGGRGNAEEGVGGDSATTLRDARVEANNGSRTMRKAISFGYFPRPLDFSASSITVATLPDLDDSVRAIEKSSGVSGDWLYPPFEKSHNFVTGTESVRPYPRRVFGLPATHTINDMRAGSDEQLQFFVWVLGFVLGMRLTTTEAGFLDATPIKPHTLGDMHTSYRDLPRLLECADAFWTDNATEPRVATALVGSIHSLFLSHNPQSLDYEQFIYTYVSLEGCHFVWSTQNNKRPTDIGHKHRIANLCTQFNMPTPDWADPTTGLAAGRRNETLHEGLFFDEPLGFQIFGGNARASQVHAHRNILLEMQNLTSRFIVALLRIPSPGYVKSRVDTRQVIGLDLVP